MWLILCNAHDESALWAHRGLQQQGLVPLALVTSDALGFGRRWVHRVRSGKDSAQDIVEITLADGRTINGTALRGVLNRLLTLPAEHLILAHPDEREYVTQELNAFYLSWLYALPCPVLNRPTALGLSGQWRHPSEWVWLAAQAGLSTPPYQLSSHDSLYAQNSDGRLISPAAPTQTIFVVAGQAVGPPLYPGAHAACQKLATFAGTDLLGIEFAAGAADRWLFAGATTFPDLCRGGEPLLAAIARALQS
jgi:hypothetical protein